MGPYIRPKKKKRAHESRGVCVYRLKGKSTNKVNSFNFFVILKKKKIKEQYNSIRNPLTTKPS